MCFRLQISSFSFQLSNNISKGTFRALEERDTDNEQYHCADR